jgi:hypothetical protein
MKKNEKVIDIDFEIADIPDAIIFRVGGTSYRLPRQKFTDLIESLQSRKMAENQVSELNQENYVEVLRLQSLGIDSLDAVAQILGLDRAKIRRQFADALSRWGSQEDRLKMRMAGDYCKRPENFISVVDNPAALQMRLARGEIRSVSAIPNIARVAQFLRQGKNLEEIGAAMQFDKADFARWVSEHTFLIDFLSKG